MTTLSAVREEHAEDLYGRQDSWRAFAACRGMDTDLFYPEGRGSTLRRREDVAKQVCEVCPVSTQCQEAAGQAPERYGIWGGLTELERGWSRR